MGGAESERAEFDPRRAMDRDRLERYWKRTLRLTLILLGIWVFVGYVLSILLAPTLNEIEFLGGPLGFWIAQNGAIYVFWVLVLVYAVRMNRLDREFDLHDDGI